MRVLILTTNPNLGSTARILQSWLRLGRANGLQAAVVVPKQGDFSRWLSQEGVSHLIDPMPWVNKRWPIPSLFSAIRIASWARRRRIQILHCNEHDVYPFATLLNRLLRLPVVCHVRFKLPEQFAKWAFGKRIPDALLWTSRQQWIDYGPAVAGLVPEHRQHLVQLGLDLESFGTLAGDRERTRQVWGVRPDEIVIGTASALRPIKRIGDFVTLIARLAAKHPRVIGALAGDAVPGGEAYRETILEQIRSTGLGRRFVWVGHLEPIEPFHHAVDLFVSTSEYETFGNSVCEAMACGKPVVAYSGGSVGEVVGDAGIVVDIGDLDSLARAASQLVDDETARFELGQIGRNRVANEFNPKLSLKLVEDIYQAIAAG